MTTNFNDTLPLIDDLINTATDRNELLSEIAKLLKDEVWHYDWVGFYLLDSNSNNLVLGPYSGKPTEHTLIPIGKGVCGQVAESKKPKIVQDVSQENNYIACSLDVQSEIVVPILKEGNFVAEIDIDSHSPSPFTFEDETFLNSICAKLALLF